MKHTLEPLCLNMQLPLKVLNHWQSKNILDVECLKQNVLRLNCICDITD